MLWIIIFALVFFAVKYMLNSNQRKFGITVLTIIIAGASLYWCYNTPIKKDLIRQFNTTGCMAVNDAETEMLYYVGLQEQIPISYHDLSTNYTTFTESASTGSVRVYEEKFGFLKMVLSFKKPQEIFEVTYYSEQFT